MSDAINEQPWLPNGPIPFDVQWTLEGDGSNVRTREARMQETDLVVRP
ncbi:hypothetical protein [Rhodococcus sp. WB9]|nr:hypothetical protein [Rhodococcus sp. WB9]